jgi:hypothetical protein
VATVLAALRYWQNNLEQELREAELENREPILIFPAHFTKKITPLSPEEIDDLCQRLNC